MTYASPLAPLAVRLCAQAYEARRSGILPAGWATDSQRDVDLYFVRVDGTAWLVIPGTDSATDWTRYNAWPLPTRLSGVPGLWREGFREPGEWAHRFAARRLGSTEPYAIVGHSLGGATAIVAAACAARDEWAHRVEHVLAIAAPRVTTGDGARYLADYYRPEIGQRLTLGADVVPRAVMPIGWRHALHPLYVDSDTLELRSSPRYWSELWRAVKRRGWQSTQHHGIAAYLRWAERSAA